MNVTAMAMALVGARLRTMSPAERQSIVAALHALTGALLAGDGEKADLWLVRMGADEALRRMILDNLVCGDARAGE